MTRPAIVIGLGGTGQWVLTYLKKELLEVGGGHMPAGVKLLSFDTASQTAKVGDQFGEGEKKKSEEAIRIGNVSLEDGTEYISIGADLYDLAKEIEAAAENHSSSHSHLRWFPAKQLLAKLPKAAFNTTDGAGAIRQMGRLSLFNNVYPIMAQIKQAIDLLANDVNEMRNLEIIIIGSLAGGTGAGMLIDMAWLVRMEAERNPLVQQKYVLRGFFVLPSAFGADRDKMARAFAAWNELDRFMLSKVQGAHSTIVYNPTDRSKTVHCDKPTYDVTYLIDPQRPVNALLPPPEQGTFPAIAQCIAMILDSISGQTYTQHVINTIANTRATLPVGVYHSAIGSYTLKVPAYYAQEKFTLSMTLSVLDKFLTPEKNDKGTVIGVSAMHNAEVPDAGGGRTAVLSFMNAGAQSLEGDTTPNTLFTPFVADVLARAQAQTLAGYVVQIATGDITHAKSRALLALTDISQDEDGKMLKHKIDQELNWRLWHDANLADSRTVGDTPSEALTRILANLNSIRSKHYGVDTKSGQRLRGQYGSVLEEAKKAQVQRFTMLLQKWMINTLNGEDPDPLIARTGKIGFIREFLEEMCNSFILFNGFINDVREHRTKVHKPEQKAKAAAMGASNNYKAKAEKKCLFCFHDNFVHPEAHFAQRDYLRAEQRVANVRKEDILLDVMAELSAEMRQVVERTLDRVNQWVVTLATGDPNRKAVGLYGKAAGQLDNVEVNHADDLHLGNPDFKTTKELRKVSQVIGEHQYSPSDADLKEALSSLVWKVEREADGLRINCGVNMPGNKPDSPPVFRPFRQEGERIEDYNLQLMQQITERPYLKQQKDHPLAIEIQSIYNDGQDLANALHMTGEPFYAKRAVEIHPAVTSGYIRVKHNYNEGIVNYFNMRFQPKLQQLNAGVPLNLVDSEDPHKLNYVRADDLMPSQAWRAWEDCQAKYLNLIGDAYHGIPAEDLYIFPAEVNAAYYESQMPIRLTQNYRKLHPEAVALLEEKDRFILFFLAMAHGFIERKRTENGQFYWIYRMSSRAKDEPLFLTVPDTETLEIVQEDFFRMMRNFLMGHDQRAGQEQARRIDWSVLRKRVLDRELEIGKAEAIKTYKAAMERPNGIVRQILLTLDKLQKDQNEQADTSNRQRFIDLADLGRVVYLEAIDRVDLNTR